MTIGIIARKEFTDMVRDGRFRLSAGVALGLLLVALLVGWKHYRDVDAQHRRAQERARHHWVHQGEKNPHSAAHYGLYAFKPKTALSFVDRGVDPYTGVAVHLEAHKQNEFQHRPSRDGTALQRFGELTAATVLQGLIPLVIVFLAFPAFAGEREQGTLRQVLSLGVSPRDLAAGKCLGVAAALGLILVPAAALGVAALALSGGGALAAGLPGLAGMALAYLAYHAVFLGAAIASSARASSARLALVGLLGFWMANVLIAPRVAADAAKWLAPTPSALEFAAAIERDKGRGIDGHDPADRRLEALKAGLLEKYGVESVEDLPVSFAGISLQASEEYGNEVYDRHYGRLWDTFEEQDLVRQVASLASPTLAIRSLSMALAGTDNARHRDFARAAERYRRAMVGALNRDLIENGADSGFSYTADGSLWESIPHFHYDPPGAAEVLRGQPFAVAGLVLWLALALAAAHDATVRLSAD